MDFLDTGELTEPGSERKSFSAKKLLIFATSNIGSDLLQPPHCLYENFGVSQAVEAEVLQKLCRGDAALQARITANLSLFCGFSMDQVFDIVTRLLHRTCHGLNTEQPPPKGWRQNVDMIPHISLLDFVRRRIWNGPLGVRGIENYFSKYLIQLCQHVILPDTPGSRIQMCVTATEYLDGNDCILIFAAFQGEMCLGRYSFQGLELRVSACLPFFPATCISFGQNMNLGEYKKDWATFGVIAVVGNASDVDCVGDTANDHVEETANDLVFPIYDRFTPLRASATEHFVYHLSCVFIVF